jgi:hypothetical protein
MLKGQVQVNRTLGSRENLMQRYPIRLGLFIIGVIAMIIGAWNFIGTSCFGCPADGSECTCVTNGLRITNILFIGGTSIVALGVAFHILHIRNKPIQ